MPKPSTPALLPTIVSPFTPLSCSAAMRFSGMPQSPKPPAAMVMLSWSKPSRADLASGKTLSLMAKNSACVRCMRQVWVDIAVRYLRILPSFRIGGGFRHHADPLREGDVARVVLVGAQERIAQQLDHTG